jgi:hypothetical protein
VFARPARPVGGVQVAAASISRDLTRENESPVRVELAATLVDSNKQLLAGSAPLRITVADPLGVVRYDLFRGTDGGICSLSLPLAANDAAGKWTVTAKELITNTSGTAAFTYQPASQCGALAGAVPRATYFWADKENFYKFFRNHCEISIVAGSSDFEKAAAERLVQSLKPYNVAATIQPLDDAVKARPITDEEAKTWCGTALAGGLDANARKSAQHVGYNLPRPTIIIGNPADNPLIKRLLDAKVLPYVPTAEFPGPGRGMVAWNIMTLGHDVEAIACIANDAAGMGEAVGTLFQLGIGLYPYTPLVLPTSSSVAPAVNK